MADRFKAVCPKCGSETLCRDAVVRWDVDAQDWLVSSLLDDPCCCDDCGEEFREPQMVKIEGDQS